MTLPSIEDHLKQLIQEALTVPYVSSSCKDAIETGNHYQSVELGQARTQGFRSDRNEFLDLISFEGKKVLDLGSNLGEVSRGARNRGACLVDGFEYDPFFVEIACALNALNKTTRVSFYECDMTDPSVYREPYDVVLAFSVAHYVYPILKHLEPIIQKLLVVETHRLQGNLESVYIENVTKYFPAYRILGYSDWNVSSDQGGQRAVIAFARNEEVLASALHHHEESRPVEPTSKRKVASDHMASESDMPVDIVIDTQRTCLQKRFFSHFEFDAMSDLIDAVSEMRVGLDSIARSEDIRVGLYSGWAYWFLCLRGFLEFRETNGLEEDNIYLQYIVRYYGPRRHDPGLAHLVGDPVAARDRVIARFRDFLIFSTAQENGNEEPHGVQPVIVTVSEAAPRQPLRVFPVGAAYPVGGSMVDGWHRLFGARVFGVRSLPGQVVRDQALAMEGSS